MSHVTWALVASLLNLVTESASSELTVRSLFLRSHIKYRFATTLVTSTVINDDPERSHEAMFEVNLPEEAFISNFSMTVDGEVYPGRVEEKQKAAKAYQEAKDRGQSAGYIKTTARHSNKFDVSVHLQPKSLVTFNLTYQQVLARCHGKYEHKMHVNPGRVVRDLKVEVFIEEARNIIELDTSLKKDQNDVSLGKTDVIVENPNARSRYIVFSPSPEQQHKAGEKGMEGEFIVKYDVERTSPAGEVLIIDGYFLHFFAPENSGDMPPVPKDIVFVLDVSGSMNGIKIRQLKEAMKTILTELSSKDRFSIVTFNDRLRWWKSSLVPVDSETLKAALQFVDMLDADDGTNINLALTEGVEFLLNNKERLHTSIVFFLTDGQATVGVKNPRTIANNVERNNENVASVFGLAFGDGADYNLVKIISVQNNGFARRIYEAADASQQVEGFYDEISNTMMLNLSISYFNGTVQDDTLTPTFFRNVFKGNDVVVAGKVEPNVLLTNVITGIITAETTQGQVNLVLDNDSKNIFLTPDPINNTYFQMPVDFSAVTEKSWAYLKIKDLLKRKKKETYKKVKDSNTDEEILQLSLKYNFVTPLTSMVATKPEDKTSKASVSGDEYKEAAFPERGIAKQWTRHSPKRQPSAGQVAPILTQANYHYLSNGNRKLISSKQGLPGMSFDQNAYDSRAMAMLPSLPVPVIAPKATQRSKVRRKHKKGRGKSRKSKKCTIVKTILEGFVAKYTNGTTCLKVRKVLPGTYHLFTHNDSTSVIDVNVTFSGTLQRTSLTSISVKIFQDLYYILIDKQNNKTNLWGGALSPVNIYKQVTCKGRRGVARVFVSITVFSPKPDGRNKRDVLKRSRKQSRRKKNPVSKHCIGRPKKESLSHSSTRYMRDPPSPVGYTYDKL